MEFKPAIDEVYLMGNFKGWQTKTKMNDDDRDTESKKTATGLYGFF